MSNTLEPVPQVGRWHVGGVCDGLLGEETCSTRTEASMTEMGRSTEACRGRVGVSKLGRESLYGGGACSGCMFMWWGRGGKWHQPASLFLGGSLWDLCLSAHALK